MEKMPLLTPGQRFWRLLAPDKQEIRNVYLYAFFNGLISLSLPLGIQAIVNLIQGGQFSTSWVLLVVFVILGIILSGVMQYSQLRITETLQQKIFTRAAFEFAWRIPRIRLEALYRHYAPELMNRFFDILAVQKGLSKILIDFSLAALNVTFGIILLSLYHPFFILFGIVLVLLVYILLRFTFDAGMRSSLKESKYKYQVAHWLEELARTHITFKMAPSGDLPLQHTDRHSQSYMEARESHFLVLMRQFGLMVLFKVLVVSGLLVLGGLLVMDQQMNIGQFVAAEIVILMVISAVEKLVLSLETIYDVLTALEKIGQVTDMELDSETGMDLPQAPQGMEIKLNGLHFSYPGAEKETLRGITWHVRSGERWLITGTNASGKRTLLHLLAGLYEVNPGQVTYDGFTRGNLSLTALRSQINGNLNEEKLFHGTVYENISLGRAEATLDRVIWAAQNLGLEPFIQSMPQGYDSMLDPQGSKLPGSVVQKLLLARTVVTHPRLLLLEDTLDVIAAGEREKILDFLTDPRHPWTLIMAASDTRYASRTGRVAVMQGGKMKHTGTVDELRKQNLI